jgi:ABC-type uncharacterized transport system permease subunit
MGASFFDFWGLAALFLARLGLGTVGADGQLQQVDDRQDSREE